MKTDARVRYTKMRIREAFLFYLERKPVSKITVKELCDRAEINRATFYKHYADPFELLEKLEEEALEEFERMISNCRQTDSQRILVAILEKLRDKENPYALLTSENANPGFAGRISELFYREFRSRLAQKLPLCTEEEKDALYLFVAGGSAHLISAWMKDGMKTSSERAADELEKLCGAATKAYG